jgi:hypothetical protein
MDMQSLYNQYPVTVNVLREKKGVTPEVQRKKNQTQRVVVKENRLGTDWFSLAIEKKALKTRKA